MRQYYKIFLVVIIGGFLFYLIPAQQALAVPACIINNRYACSQTLDCAGLNCGTMPCVNIDVSRCNQPAVIGASGGPAPQPSQNPSGSVGPGPGSSPQNFEIPNPIGVDNFQDLVNIIGRWIFNLAIPIAVAIIIYAGVLMLTSGGEPKRFQKGTEALKWAVIGLAVVLIGKGFVSLIQSILSLRE